MDRERANRRRDRHGDGLASWARGFGGNYKQRLDGDAQPDFDGDIYGAQLGQDLFTRTNASNTQDRLGLFGGYAHARGDVQGTVGGLSDTKASRSASTDATALTASLETGYPFHVAENWTLEPQAQINHQRTHVDDFDDDISDVKLRNDNATTGWHVGRNGAVPDRPSERALYVVSAFILNMC